MKIAKTTGGEYLGPFLKMMNRHGLIAGATGTGKTVTLKKFAEMLSAEGVPTFVIDVKGDLSGFVSPGREGEKFAMQLQKFDESYPVFCDFPVRFWDLYGENGLPIRTTVSGMGPLLMSALMECNDVQSAIVHSLFQYADENGYLLLDFKDFKSLVEFAYQYPEEFSGSFPKASLAAIMRQLNFLEGQQVDVFFGERELDFFDFQSMKDGKAVINVLDARRLFLSPKLYSTFLLWLLGELYEQFDEVGDSDRPRMVFFFDEAHLIFDGISSSLLNRVEQVVRLIRSKGIGIYFISQSPTDIPDSVLSQCGNRVQHAMRAFTAKEIKNLKLAAQGYRLNPELEIEKAMLELGVGEALCSFLGEDGVPGITKRAYILPPRSLMGAYPDADRFPVAMLNAKYREQLDRDSAYEMLMRRVEDISREKEEELARKKEEKERIALEKEEERERKAEERAKKRRGSLADRVGKSFVDSMTRRTGSMLARGLMGTIKKVLK